MRSIQAELPLLKQRPETSWLANTDSQSLQFVLRELDRSFTRFLQKRSRFPKFKSRKRDQPRFTIPQRVYVDGGRVFVPKIGRVRVKQSRVIDIATKSATFKRDAVGSWHVTFVGEFVMPDTAMPFPDPSRVVGVDLGLKDFAVLSNGIRIAAPKFFRKSERKLRKAQRTMSRRKKSSGRRLRAKRKIALIYRKISSQRSDFLHKLTTNLVKNYDGICIEDLSVKGLAKTKLAKSVLDASFGEFRRQLEYKTIWNRRHLAVVSRWYPSSKTCHACATVNRGLSLADRTWTCTCGVCQDRDLNAALNIHSEGFKIVAAGYAET